MHIQEIQLLISFVGVWQQEEAAFAVSRRRSSSQIEGREDEASAPFPNSAGGERRRRGGVSAEVYTEEDAASYVRKVTYLSPCLLVF